MEISLAGIEEALGGLRYRETSPKARLLSTIHTFYKKSTSPDEVRAIDSDELIDLMWNLGGDRTAIRSRRKNLSSIKSSVNQDLDIAWEEGRNPEGITIGPLNTFVMSDAAKDKILNSFSGSIGLEGGKSLERVAEALKIVSDYLSEMPPDIEGEQLSNLKTLIEGFSEKFLEEGDSGVKVIEKIIYRDGTEGEDGGPAEAEAVQGEGQEDGRDGMADGEGELLGEGGGEEDSGEVETEVEVEDADEVEIVYENEPDEIHIDALDDFETVEEADEFEEVVDDEEDDLVEILDDDLEPACHGEEGDEDVVELVGADGLEESDEVELVDEDDLIEEENEDFDDIEDVPEVEAAVEDEVEELDDDMEIVEKEVEGEGETEADHEAPAEASPGNKVGLPIDQLVEDIENFEEFQLDEEQKRLLAERFDGYLGAMERYYNQYIFIKKGSYQVGADKAEEDVLNEQQVLMADYYMGKYPITNALFEIFIERTGYKTTAEKLGYGYVYHGRFRKVVDPNTGFTSSIWNSTYTREKVKGATWYQPLGPGSTLHKKRNHPVVQVSIRDARTFAAWTGKRLPSEIEWEAAARTQAGYRYPWGNEWIEGFCNFENSGVSDTCPVDNFPHSTNETGLADLLGNVMEWTSDECEPKYPLEIPARFFIAKGGAWVSPEQTTLYSRSRFEAEYTSNILGFRCLAD